MRILVTGATGFIGGHVTNALQRAGHAVVACVRSRDGVSHKLSGVSTVEGDFSRDHKIDDWLPRLEGIDAVVNCVGIIREQQGQKFDALHKDGPIALFRACEKAGVIKIVQISALGADDSSVSHYHRSKKAADDVLPNLNLPWVILQPSIVYGPGAKSSMLFRALASLPVIPLVADGSQPVQPVHVSDLTAVVLRAIESSNLDRQRIPVVGPQPVAMKQLLTLWRQWLGFGAARFFSVPYKLALAGAQLLGFLGSTPINGDAVRMLARGNTGDVALLRAALGREPVSIQTALNLEPAQQADAWHARLYFLLPLLRISLGLLWIATGIISAFIYPPTQSYALLAPLGIDGWVAPVALYGAAILDFGLGAALILRRHVVTVGLIQISVIVAYSLLIAVGLPEYWVHPFGPVTKNIPLLVATLVIMATETRR